MTAGELGNTLYMESEANRKHSASRRNALRTLKEVLDMLNCSAGIVYLDCDKKVQARCREELAKLLNKKYKSA